MDDLGHLLVGDQFGVFFEYLPDAISAPSANHVLESLRPKMNKEKGPISVISSGNRVHGLLDVPKENTENNLLFSQSIMSDVVRDICEYKRMTSLKDHASQLENAIAHNFRLSVDCIAAGKARKVRPPT
jgi:aromatic ring-opening dioxygenase catalytic subunit (LigB family)